MVPSKVGFLNLIFIGFKEALVTGIPRVPESYFSKVHIYRLGNLGESSVRLEQNRPFTELQTCQRIGCGYGVMLRISHAASLLSLQRGRQ